MSIFSSVRPIELAEAACATMMKKYDAKELPPEGHFHYHQGVFLSGVEQTYLNTGKKEYSDYIKRWIDSLIDADGNVNGYDTGTLDDKQPAILMFRLLDETGDKRYEKAIKYIVSGIQNWPVNKEGGFYHKKDMTDQMWLDGLYMVGELLTRYGVKYNDEKMLDTVYRQAKLMWDNIRDPKTNLLYHAWDYSHAAKWADRETGLSPCFWGRAAGWYIVALTTILKYMPDNYRNRAELIKYTQDYVEAFTKYQDEKTGLWYQVMDHGNDDSNWTETSCSALFLCGLSMALKGGYIDEKYRAAADKAYAGLAAAMEEDSDGGLVMPRICIGTGVGDYEHYIKRPRRENDLHGMGALLLGCNAYWDILN